MKFWSKNPNGVAMVGAGREEVHFYPLLLPSFVPKYDYMHVKKTFFSSLCLKVLLCFVLLARSEKTNSKYCLTVKTGERQVVFYSNNVKGHFDSLLRQVVI